ncbi:hypothetical protein [Aeromonas caviae]|uniref:hypothetical protein n=1 Tax=Aeromonas caviae TaxID=648 RepID=UPI0029DA8A22|nr:hypothetical protein [Aeromonas caviae]MDX7716277.1 hypothetical protein [Aeromonas caviae]
MAKWTGLWRITNISYVGMQLKGKYMKHGSIIIIVLGLLIVGAIIGIAITDHQRSYLDYLNTVASLAQAVAGGATVYLAYFVYHQWKTQLLYPRYIEIQFNIYDAFESWHREVTKYYWWAYYGRKSEKPDRDSYEKRKQEYFSLLLKHDLLIEKFTTNETFNILDSMSVDRELTSSLYAFLEKNDHELYDAFDKHLAHLKTYKVALNSSIS